MVSLEKVLEKTLSSSQCPPKELKLLYYITPLLPVFLTVSFIKTLFSYIMPSAPLSPQCPPQELEMAGPLSAARPQSPSNWDAASFTEILTPTPLYSSSSSSQKGLTVDQ